MASDTSGQVPSAGNPDIKKNRKLFTENFVRITGKHKANMGPRALEAFEEAKKSGNIVAIPKGDYERKNPLRKEVTSRDGLKHNPNAKIKGLYIFDSRTYESLSHPSLFGKKNRSVTENKYATIDNRDIYDTETGVGGRATPAPKLSKEKSSGAIPKRQGKAMGGYTERWSKARGR